MYFFTSFDSPLRFKKDCDLESTHNERSIENCMRNCAMILENGIPLFSGGSLFPKSVFDPNDVAFSNFIGNSIMEAISKGEDRVFVDTVIVQPDGHNSSIIIPYVIKYKGDKWQSLRIDGWNRS
jgi:hypothetical protein